MVARKLPDHGRRGYELGCRCDTCRTEQSEYHRKRREHLAATREPNRQCPICDKKFFAENKLAITCGRSCGSVHAQRGKPSGPRGPVQVAYHRKDAEAFLEAIRRKCTITESGCWDWAGKANHGYGIISIYGESACKLVHRLTYMAANNWVELGKAHAHHKCANRGCVNPDHLERATAAANAAEMHARNDFLARIAELESALREVAPDHPAIANLGVS